MRTTFWVHLRAAHIEAHFLRTVIDNTYKGREQWGTLSEDSINIFEWSLTHSPVYFHLPLLKTSLVKNVLRKWASLCRALLCIIIYWPQQVSLGVWGPNMYNQLLSSESGPHCAWPLYNYQLLLSSESGPQCARPLTVLRKWASLFTALICIVNYCPKKAGLNVCGP